VTRNVEVKARLTHIAELEPQVAPLANAGPTAIAQDDTFFHCAQGRLKLRVFADGHGELIAYERSDTRGPKLSDYVRVPVAEPAALREALTRACGQRGRVIKQRTLYLIGATRVHLDVVEGLGHFMELEVVLREEQTLAEGEAIAQQLLVTLGIHADQLCAQAYIDLLEHAAQAAPAR
jgi:predicted adenylyl cyclase CyaB